LREAGWLAGVFQNIYFDLSVVTHFSGASTERVMATALEYATGSTGQSRSARSSGPVPNR
jgi:predicted TIM-barrel fold metal-dependent hydrolase